MMKAQILYDLREKYEFCSATDLHDFFAQQIGDPSPAGNENVRYYAALEFVENCFAAIAHNSPSLANWAKRARLEATLRMACGETIMVVCFGGDNN